MGRLTIVAWACALVTFTAGCASSPVSRFYTLSAAAVPATASSNVSVSVGTVSVPEVVDRPQIVTALGPNQVWLDEFNRWASPLQSNIARVVVDNLVAMLGTPNVSLFREDADFRVSVEVQRFESVPGQATTLDAVWTVRRVKDGKVATGRTTAREALREKGYDAIAAGHSRALAKLSEDIAGAVRRLNNSQP